MMMSKKITELRNAITENLRVQKGTIKSIPYIDVSNALNDICTRQNHTVFGRRGCGKTLLLHHSKKKLEGKIKVIYLNCEDFKHHSFPNVLIEILDAMFEELEVSLSGWFKSSNSKKNIKAVRKKLETLRVEEDTSTGSVVETHKSQKIQEVDLGTNISSQKANFDLKLGKRGSLSHEKKVSYLTSNSKIKDLNLWLPALKKQIQNIIDGIKDIGDVFLQLDDFYHLKRDVQPQVMDYIHRICKDSPFHFKIATLRHASILFSDRDGQPIGAQERHDYQSINVDFTFIDFQKTYQQNLNILYAFGDLVDLKSKEIDSYFRGEAFKRLVMAGGGVPRDCLSLLLEVLDPNNLKKIIKDDIRIKSRSNFERRIEELKQDSEAADEAILINGIYVLRAFCLSRKTNIMMVSEEMMQQEDGIRELMNRLLDYRIIHSVGTALTHKSTSGTFQAFAIDIGCYAHLRKLKGKFNEIDVSEVAALDKIRSAPVLTDDIFIELWRNNLDDAKEVLNKEKKPKRRKKTSKNGTDFIQESLNFE